MNSPQPPRTLSLEEVAQKLHDTKSRIRHAEARAIRKIREALFAIARQEPTIMDLLEAVR